MNNKNKKGNKHLCWNDTDPVTKCYFQRGVFAFVIWCQKCSGVKMDLPKHIRAEFQATDNVNWDILEKRRLAVTAIYRISKSSS